MHPFASWLVLIGDATPDRIRVVRSVLVAISSLGVVVLAVRVRRHRDARVDPDLPRGECLREVLGRSICSANLYQMVFYKH